MRIGIDFGTTNSAVAVAHGDGTASLLELFPGEPLQRTVLHCDPSGVIRYGNAGFRQYVEEDLDGRLLRSLKAFLSADVPKTQLGGRLRTFDELIVLYLRFLIRRTEEVTGETVDDVVVGRPVHFNVDRSRDERARERLERAIQDAGITRYRLQLEPVAAALTYERTLTRQRNILVGDFGGGTADFAILRVGPERFGRTDRTGDVLATSGVAQAGDALDGRFMDVFLLDWFGRGAHYHEPYDKETWHPWNHPIQRRIQRLYYLHLLRDPALERRLEAVMPRMDDRHVVRRILRLVFDDLGYPMAWAIEQAKRRLSEEPTTLFRFDDFHSPTLDFATTVDRERFAAGSDAILEAYGDAVDEALASAGLDDTAIDDVFLTGGTSHLPFVRDLFARRFGHDRLRSGENMTSVALGLALTR
jgi:hypothetical chaperone protein